MNKTMLKQIQAHAADEFPKESCGVVIREAGRLKYVPCRNDAKTPSEHFIINAGDKCDAEDRGEVTMIIHSHPDVPPMPSMADRVSCELHALPWGIVGWPGGEMEWFKPTGFEAPLLGREFSHGLLDCWGACRDWYAREAGLQLANFERHDLWWEDEHGPSHYEDNFMAVGFERVDSPQRGDLLVLQVPTLGRPCFHPNHAAIYLGDEPAFTSEPAPTLGGAGPFIYHHMPGRLASREVFGWSQANRVRLILRHKDYRP